MSLPPVPAKDLYHVLMHTQRTWSTLSGAHFFIAGATGFYGKWLLECIIFANRQLDCGITATLLSRSPGRFALESPALAIAPEFTWLQGTTFDFPFPKQPCDVLIDFATPSAAEVSVAGKPLIDTTLAGCQRLLEFARHSNAKRLLYASSGVAKQHSKAGAYAELKRRSELLYSDSGMDHVIARGFAFIGPYLPLTTKFAAGSFICDAIEGRSIRVDSDGTAVRSYLYAADLMIWLLTLIDRSESGGIYDVGSDHSVTIAELARSIGAHGGGLDVQIRDASGSTTQDVYLPNLNARHQTLGLRVHIDLDEAIARTLSWAAHRVFI